ncbi:MAG TPA: hypothetical protein V6C85_37565 [Allocoleopsis sp.]
MTSPKEIQSLIADIDSILPRVDARRPWSKPSEAARERRVLERVRSYLASQQQQSVVAAPQELSASSTQSDVTREVVQAVAREIEYLRADLLQPLQTDVAALQQERESLIQEIRALERTRQHLAPSPQSHTYEQQRLEEFSQELIRRCGQSLTQQLARVLTSWETRLANAQSQAIASRTVASDGFDAIMPSPDLESIQQLQAQSDRMLAALDANQRAIFEALQRDLQSYQESLSQGLDKMHTLSTQGQMLLSAVVENLSQQLGRVTSTLTAPSAQLPGLTPLTSTAPTPPTTPPTTLLPSDSFSATEPMPPTSFEGMPVEPPSEPHVGEPESSAAPPDKSTTSAESLSGTPATADWEVVEGLDSEQLSGEPNQNDELNTFIQLNLDSQPSLPLVEESVTASRANSQELDAWLSQLLGESTTDTASTVPGAGEALNLEAPDWRTDSRRQEIDELYESLFGTGSLSTPVQPEGSTAAAPDTSRFDVQEQQEGLFNSDAIAPLSSQVEDSLFSGLSDPATETVQTPQPAPAEEQWSQSWESLFFEDAASPSSEEPSLPGDAPTSSLPTDVPSNEESTVEQEGIKTISALTDLFDEMGLSHALPAIEGSSLPTPTPPLPQEQTLEPDVPVTEDDYTPASPDEDLSPIPQPFDIGSDREIQLDLELLQQLQQDFESFEGSRSDRKREIAPPPDLPRDEFEPPSVVPRPEPETQQHPQFLMSNELLAEDWEEFSPYEWSEGDPTARNSAESATPGFTTPETPDVNSDSSPGGTSLEATTGEMPDPSMLATPESVESDFEPDLFPSEALELDQEHAMHMTDTSPEELAMPGEPTVLDDDPFVEMLWDEPTDSLTEEITPAPESRFDSQPLPGQTHDLEPGEADSTEATTPNEQVQEESSQKAPGTTASPDASGDVVPVPPEAAQDSEQPDAIASEGTTSDENQPLETRSESPKPDDSSPSEGSSQTEPSSSEQSNHERTE